jgi:hypothetical protein
MANFDFPGDFPVVGEGRKLTVPWASWFTRANRTVQAVNQSGTTANRPTSGLWVGRPFFDTTLNKPIWVKAVSPAVVWVDATGASV